MIFFHANQARIIEKGLEVPLAHLMALDILGV